MQAEQAAAADGGAAAAPSAAPSAARSSPSAPKASAFVRLESVEKVAAETIDVLNVMYREEGIVFVDPRVGKG